MRYLSDVVYHGYASQQQLVYTFSSESVTHPIDIELVGKLFSRGIAKETASRCIISHGSEAIEKAVMIFDIRISGGYSPKNKSGFMMDIINNPDKYVNVIEESKELRKVLNEPKQAKAISNREDSLPEPLPKRDSKQGNMLLTAVLQENQADRELRNQVVEAFVRYELTTEDLISLVKLTTAEARIRAQGLLKHTSDE